MDVPIDYFTQQHWDNVAAYRGFGLTSCAQALISSVRDGIGEIKADVLDVGVGNAALAVAFTADGARVAGIDLSRRGLADARAQVADCLATGVIAQPVRLLQMDAQQVAFADSSFDVVTMVKTIWVFPDPVRSLAELGRVLRPDGRVLIQCWEQPATCSMIMTGARTLAAHVPSLRLPAEVHGSFEFVPDQMTAMLTKAGFRDIEFRHYDQDFEVDSAAHYWELFRSLAGTAYFAYASQPAAEQAEICADWLARTDHLRSGGKLRLRLRWMITSARPDKGEAAE
jgi:SAM-dependent methyltransferase